MTRLVVVLPLSQLVEGDSFSIGEWPLHITVLPPFLTDATSAEVESAIRSATSGFSALRVVVAHEEQFGRRHDIPVNLIADNGQLVALHHSLRTALTPLAANPEEPAFTGRGYRPHVTMKTHGRVHAGDEFELSQLALVDMAPLSAPGPAVLATIDLPRPGGKVGP